MAQTILPMRRSLPIVAALALLASSCAQTRVPGLVLASDPPGARVFVDGVDSGQLTPCYLDVERDEHRVEFRLDGYETATRLLEDEHRTYLVPFHEATIGPQTWRFPLWLQFHRFFLPVRRDVYFSPTRIFVRLRIAGE